MFYDILIGARVVSSRESKDCPADMKGSGTYDIDIFANRYAAALVAAPNREAAAAAVRRELGRIYQESIDESKILSVEQRDCPDEDEEGPEVVDWFVAGDESLDWELHPSELDLFYAQEACKNANL